ncbi:MAG: hypothetical protein IPN76_31655 [Saprospiraceae bacterium]|jgi:hypothetical protein|nr:hypothetical protein [Saprospiraceae bacterium]
MKKLLFFAFVVAAAFMACNKDDDTNIKPVQLDKAFNLAVNETAELETDGTRIKFLGISEDSRCPTGVNCVWEGEAIVQLSVEKEDDAIVETLTTNPREGQMLPDKFTAFGHGVKLLQVMPYPEAGSSIEEGDYVIRLIIGEPFEGDNW